ncbi:MAG: phosphoethanolamine--lipid A transferase [Burkholderiaceae bacterium]|nr:phosphoethanolamine--lipid A transferase [Burkholderiaceae bacterium]
MKLPTLELPRISTLCEAPARPRFTVDATVEQLIVVASLFWALAANRSFLSAALQGRSLTDASSWGFGAAMLVLVVALHGLLLALVANRWTIKPLLVLLTLGTASASYYMGAYGVILDPSMLRNVLRTDVGEARELLGPQWLLHMVVYAGLPLLLLWRVRVVERPWLRAAGVRLVMLLLSAAVLAGVVLAVFQPFSSLMRNHKELRYLITPANYLWSIGSIAVTDAKGAARPRQPIGLDAAAGPSWAARRKPLVVVVVVGETARAANWGLSGYARQTTPQLAQLPVLNFSQVQSCGTNTEVSVPCMFAPVGRRDYDEARIRGQESLLHVAARAGVAVQWRDNQSGCKGTCDGLPGDTVSALNAPGLCSGDHCLDEGLVHDLDQRLSSARGTQLWVMHMLGNHGPSYFRRYPPAFARFQPECRDDDLRRCSTEQITNSYDNALLYTDHVLATAIAKLEAHAGEVDAALLYVSDHGESLGERNLFLHGVPYAIAPDVQTRVPMVMWFSGGFERAAGLARGCLRPALQQQAARPLAHDHLFHTVLGLLDVRTQLHDAAFDLSAGCREPAAAVAVAAR